MLNYLWNFDKFQPLNWGIKNLEFMLALANDIQDLKIYEILLNPATFGFILRDLNFYHAMDFIEDYLINNSFIPHEMKVELLNSDYMVPYSFIGALLHLCSADDSIEEEEEFPLDEEAFKEVKDLYNRLTSFDVVRIIHCHKVVKKLKKKLEEIEPLNFKNQETKL